MDNLWALNFYTCFIIMVLLAPQTSMIMLTIWQSCLLCIPYVQGESCFFIYKEFILFGGVSAINKTLDGLVYAVVL